MDERRERRLDQATWLLVAVIALALALNGLPFWARRVGLLEPVAYGRDLARFCAKPPPTWWVPATCRPHRLAASGPPPRFERLDVRRLYRLRLQERWWKVGRQAVLPLLLVGSAWLTVAGWQAAPALPALAPLLPLLLSTLAAFWISLPLDGRLATLAAALPSLWIPLAALAGWLTPLRRLRMLADGAAILVLLQLPVLLLEAMRGLPMPFGGPASPWLPTRLSALMNQPNSLGGLLALSAALCLSVSRRPWQRWPLLALALTIALLARSGTGVVALALLAAAVAFGHLPRRWRLLLLVGALVALAIGLPRLVGRPQLYGSPAGRVGLVREWLARPRPALEIWLGHGLASQGDPRGVHGIYGAARRALLTGGPGLEPAMPAAAANPEEPATGRKGRGPSGDGQPLLLLAQGGVVALAAFYGLVAWCAWRDPLLRPFWAVLLITSLTLNVTEVFPVAIWLAVATRRALGGAGGGPGGDAGGPGEGSSGQ